MPANFKKKPIFSTRMNSFWLFYGLFSVILGFHSREKAGKKKMETF